MTKDDIMKLALKSGPLTQGPFDAWCQRFAALVAAAKAEVALAEAYRCGYEAGAVEEREACEMAVEDIARKYQKLHDASLENIADECAAAIRARIDK